MVDKATSVKTFSPVDYKHISACWEDSNQRIRPESSWKRSMEALHGDFFWSDETFALSMRQDLYCQTRCVMNTDILNQVPAAETYEYRFWVDRMPTAYLIEDDESVTARYWSGIPITVPTEQLYYNARYGDVQDEHSVVFNHYNFIIDYYQSGEGRYRILRTTIEPFSMASNPDGSRNQEIASCRPGSTEHTSYEMLMDISPQFRTGNDGAVLFTYDVIWRAVPDAGSRDYKDRWSVFLTMDHAQPLIIKFLGIFISLIVTGILLGSLWTWVMRDLSYKPVMIPWDDGEEDNMEELPPEAIEELRIWPLSTRIFFPPRHSPFLFSVLCGTGAHVVTTGLLFVVLFRLGIISQSLWADILTVGAVLYTICSVIGGYVTGRLFGGIFQSSIQDTIAGALLTGTAFPAIGIVVIFLVYDVLPAEAPEYAASKQNLPWVLLWIFLVLPLTVLGGWLGHRAGPLSDFPVSTGSLGYHDLDLQREQGKDTALQSSQTGAEDRWCSPICYILALLAGGGLLPVLGVFVSYSYNVTGPVFVGYYTDNSSFLILSYALFLTCAGAVSVLCYYKQIRDQYYEWWWPAFCCGGSSGLYLFLLTLSWLLFFQTKDEISGRVWLLHCIWFLYTSLGVFVATGFTGVATCIAFTRALYVRTKERGVEI